MGKRGESFGERIEEEDGQGDRRQFQAQGIQFAGGKQEHQHRNRGKSPGEPRAQDSCRNVPHAGSRIARVDIGVEDSIERHGSRARADHRHHDPKQLESEPPRIKMALPECQQGAGKRERQGKHGVLELDHFERQPQPLPKGRNHRVFATILIHACGIVALLPS